MPEGISRRLTETAEALKDRGFYVTPRFYDWLQNPSKDFYMYIWVEHGGIKCRLIQKIITKGNMLPFLENVLVSADIMLDLIKRSKGKVYFNFSTICGGYIQGSERFPEPNLVRDTNTQYLFDYYDLDLCKWIQNAIEAKVDVDGFNKLFRQYTVKIVRVKAKGNFYEAYWYWQDGKSRIWIYCDGEKLPLDDPRLEVAISKLLLVKSF